MYLVHGVPVCINSSNLMSRALVTMILQNSDARRVPWPKKLLRLVFAPVEEYYGSEVTLHYPGLYAGQTDLICNHNGMETVVDFKQANRPKKKEWIEDYYLQIAAYAMAHDYVYGSRLQQGVIMVCTPDLYYQEFKVEGPELKTLETRILETFRYVS